MAKRSWRMRMGKLVRVPNKAKKFGANESYLLTKLQRPRGAEFYALFTDHQIEVALRRARKNPEDVIHTAKLVDLLD